MASDKTMFDTKSFGIVENYEKGKLPTTVDKEIIFGGADTESISPPYPDGTRVRFHFETKRTNDGKMFDDSRKHPKAMELIIGKKFKVEIWEMALHTMKLKEVSRFIVPRQLCALYPMVAKVIRDTYNKPCDSHRSKSCCGSMLNGTGHADLDELLKCPESLTFTFELLEVALPGCFEMESWYMTDDQKIESLTTLQEDGNKLFGQKQYKLASEKYFEGIARIEQLLNKEVPGSDEMKQLKMKKVPLLLNYAFCKQKENDYYESITHNNSVLEIDPNNVKALFRRGQCHKNTGSYGLARDDFDLVLQLDRSLETAVKTEIEEIVGLEKDYEKKDKARYQNMFTV